MTEKDFELLGAAHKRLCQDWLDKKHEACECEGRIALWFGWSNFSYDKNNHSCLTEREASICRALIGPNGWSIFKMLEAKYPFTIT
jgi:hypothetical protein